MPVVEFGRADEHAQGADGEADVGVDVDGPDAAEGDEAGERVEREPEEERREVDECQGVDGVDRVFTVRGEPIEVL
jgi:hypothetical protein